MDTIILRTNKLCKSFSIGGVQQHVLKNLDLSINKGDFTVIMGSSGSGKSTLLYALSGMDIPTVGDVFLGEENIAKLSNDKLALIRRKNCGFVFQSIYLLDNMNILDNVLTSGLLLNRNKKEVFHKAQTLLKSMGLNEQDFVKFPNQLSGGEKQRVAIVRAIINNPKILFADEPTGALNSASSTQVLDNFTRLNEDGQSIIMVTHDIKTALRGNRILYVKDGTVCGELNMKPYKLLESSNRMQKLQQFLGEMGW
ncbi:ABC transporter ATP-binding protein [Anaerocolumna cellulosilytica]|uniref:ABC transporter ATP-binding protein n=1 Tax=Anaerocolumna cellulosilytica TaxID=433286 RepID=A0A6S6R454_9FIRM|nr:ABC transporter ATP-binding protein [Anaerocolumna cellulosilytica]MBB5194801.1 putative ABC transport system ATP-binding protein [Anaerocolumna cellulosilytica]BCJ94235.1 ABC transporter ATP-binding protein [Anaerocolumna cellulosilytica]